MMTVLIFYNKYTITLIFVRYWLWLLSEIYQLNTLEIIP